MCTCVSVFLELLAVFPHVSHTSRVMQCFICIHHIHLSSHIHPLPEVSVCLSAAYSPLCHFRVVSMRCRNLQISSFGPQHIRQDYPQAAYGLSPCLSASSATAHQADRSTAHLTPAAFPGFSSVSHPAKQTVNQKTCLLL